MRASRLAVVAVLACAGLLALGIRAAADGGRCGERGRPACSILRPPDEDALPVGSDAFLPDCVVLVGGFGSAQGDDTFDRLLAWANADPRYRLWRFGRDRADRYAYDTTGAIDVSGEDLRSLVRSIRDECAATDIVTHSMGGAVADRAFSMGFVPADRVATYIALAGPHNGATLARALRPAIEADPIVAVETSLLAATLRQPDPVARAASDLARIRPPRPVRVPAVRLRIATDPMVLRRDSADRRVDVREYVPTLAQIEGHGGILRSERISVLLGGAIGARAIPADTRSGADRAAADVLSRKLDDLLAARYADLGRYLRDDPMAKLSLAEALVVGADVRVLVDAVGDLLHPHED